MKKFILWDNDGVLVDTEYWYFSATQRALAELGVRLEKSRYLQRMVHGASSWELARASGIAADQIAAKQRQRDVYYQRYLRHKDIAIAGVEDILEKLAQHYRMAVVTTAKRADFELIHRNRPLLQHMEFVLTREDYVASKPAPEPYLKALQRFDADPQQCLVVEDSQRGLQAALAAGIDCAIVHNAFTASHDFSGACCRLESLAALPAALQART